MNAQNRILNSAIQRFVKTPVNAPSYYDLKSDDNLQQCNEREVISIFGETHIHYRWVDYCGSLELMSFTKGDCVWRFGSIDPSKEPTDILNLNGVNPEDPSTYNNSFYILKENNICIHVDSYTPFIEEKEVEQPKEEKPIIQNQPIDSSLLAPISERIAEPKHILQSYENEKIEDPFAIFDNSNDDFSPNEKNEVPSIEIQPNRQENDHIQSVQKNEKEVELNNKPTVSVQTTISSRVNSHPINTSTVKTIPSTTGRVGMNSTIRSASNVTRPVVTTTTRSVTSARPVTSVTTTRPVTTSKPIVASTTRPVTTSKPIVASTSRPVTSTTSRPVTSTTSRPITTTTRPVTSSRPVTTTRTVSSTTRPVTTSTTRPVTTTTRPVTTTRSIATSTTSARPVTSTTRPITTTTSRPVASSTTRPVSLTSTKPTTTTTTTRPITTTSRMNTSSNKPTPSRPVVTSSSTTTRSIPLRPVVSSSRPVSTNKPVATASTTRPVSSSTQPSYMRQTKASLAHCVDTPQRPPIGRIVNPNMFNRIGAVSHTGERPQIHGTTRTSIVSPLTGNRCDITK